MAFPTTPVLTTFTGTDESPLSEGGAWAGPMQNGQGQLRRVSNHAQAALAGVAPHQSERVTVYGADQEAYGFWQTLPASGQGFAVWARLTNPDNVATAQAVLAVYTEGTGFRIFEFTIGTTFNQIGSTNATVAADNQGIGIELIGTAVKAKYWNGSAWSDVVTTTTTIAGAGQIGLELNGADITAGSFGGGTYSPITYKPPALVRRSRRVSWS
jgi:hypothetical protein